MESKKNKSIVLEDLSIDEQEQIAGGKGGAGRDAAWDMGIALSEAEIARARARRLSPQQAAALKSAGVNKCLGDKGWQKIKKMNDQKWGNWCRKHATMIDT